MKMLTCSKLSNYLIGSSKKITKQLALLLLIGSFSVQAQDINQIQKKPESTKLPAKWLQASELPMEASEPDNIKKKSGLINTAVNWFRTTDLPGDLQIHGFASQAYITTSDNDFFGNSNSGGTFGLTEAGLNASMRPLPRLQVSAQVLSRRAGEGNTGMPRLDYAFLDYRLYSHEVNQFGIRVGRLKNPFGFYNDTRDVAFTRPGILLPQSIYFDRTRNLGLSSDSVQLYGDTAIFNWGTLSTQFGVTLPIVSDRDTESSLLGDVRRGHLNREVSYIGRGIFETNDKRIRLGISGIWLNTSYDPSSQSGDPIGPGALRFTPIIFSAQYNAERWTLTSEYAIRHFKYDNSFRVPGLNGLDFYGESYYFQGEYRFTPKWEGIVRYDALFTDRSDRDGSRFAELTRGRSPAHGRFAKDIMVGLRWNVTPEFMLRAEYHHVNGTGWLSRLDNDPTKEGIPSQHWDLYAIQASYRF
ncbi:MAG: hypothetical protein KA524_05980 [Nitrosomonas sp.]|nr:hypothetical protein [Nitrosomonas sp.]MBP6075767.1 hypothetical protein [Nitrosomonas sp.]